MTEEAQMKMLCEEVCRHAEKIVEQFYQGLFMQPKSRRILEMLTEQELAHLKERQAHNLIALSPPRLEARLHKEMALRVGTIHAIVGIDKEDLAHSREILFQSIFAHIGSEVGKEAMSIYGRRLTVDLAYQLKAYQALQNAQQDVLMRITQLVWKVDNYTDFIDRATAILATHEGIAGCAIGRPDQAGAFHFEAAVGGRIGRQAVEMLASADNQIVLHADHPYGQGAVGRAWRSGQVERTLNFRTAPAGEPWQESLLHAGLHSCTAIPLSAQGDQVAAILVLFSSMPGGFSGSHQIAFIELLQTLLCSAIAKLKGTHGAWNAVSIAARQHWGALLRANALRMHYQPLLELRSGKVTKVEALARLQDGERLLMPAEFFPALSSDDFLELYLRGLDQALAERNAWLAQGIDVAIAVNLPPAALSDIRYFNATRYALTTHRCAPDKLTLEVLETDVLALTNGQQAILERFKMLGVQLAQDDLGSGHSSLARLRQFPFDCMKIDRDVIREGKDSAWDMLRFVYQLTRLGHALGKVVVAEGVETQELLDALCLLGVDVAQGYAISRPMPGDKLVGWIREHEQHAGSRQARTGSTLPRLARLLIWEERLSIDIENPVIAQPRSEAPAGVAACSGAQAAARCPLPISLAESAYAYLGNISQHAKDMLMAMVLTALQSGLHSKEFIVARQRVVAEISA